MSEILKNLKKYSAVSDYVKIIGRTIYRDGIRWLVQSGCAVEFKIRAFGFSVTFEGDEKNSSRPRYAIFADDKLIEDSLLLSQEQQTDFFEISFEKTTVIKIILLSEANSGAVGIKSINVCSSLPLCIEPTKDKNLFIEFIGDSITCGYGVEAMSAEEPYSTSTQNFMKSFAYLTAKKLDADYSAVCYSGYGINSGYTTDIQNTDMLIPKNYKYVGIKEKYREEWDFSTRTPDIILINLGTNDSSYVSKNISERLFGFERDYLEFLIQVREKNPRAFIVCTLGTMGGDEIYCAVEKIVEQYSKKDKKISCFRLPLQKQEDGYGSDWHPSEKTQSLTADITAMELNAILKSDSF